jgi:acyl carrier protein
MAIRDPVALETLVVDTLATTCQRDRNTITLHTNLIDLGIDSLTLTTVAAIVESHYEGEITQGEFLLLIQCDTVSDMVAVLNRIVPRALGT